MYYAWNSFLLTCLIVSRLLFLPWCSAITGYWIGSSNNSNSQQQTTTGYRQTSKLLPGANLPTRVKTITTEFTHDNLTMLTLCILFYAWVMVKSVAICRQKKCHITHHVKFAVIHWNFTNTILKNFNF